MHLRSLPHGVWAGLVPAVEIVKSPRVHRQTYRGFFRIRVRRRAGSIEPTGYVGASVSFVLFPWRGVQGGKPRKWLLHITGGPPESYTLEMPPGARTWQLGGNLGDYQHAWLCNIIMIGGKGWALVQKTDACPELRTTHRQRQRGRRWRGSSYRHRTDEGSNRLIPASNRGTALHRGGMEQAQVRHRAGPALPHRRRPRRPLQQQWHQAAEAAGGGHPFRNADGDAAGQPSSVE